MLGHISKYFERPEGTHEYVAEMDGLRNCACNFLQHKTFYMRENMLAASDVACFYSLATVDIFSAKIHAKKRDQQLTCGMDRGKVEHEVQKPQKSTRSAPNGDSQRGSPLPFYFRRHKNAVVEKKIL